MYERFYGLRDRPFDLTPNPRFLYLTAKHREALCTIHYGLSGRKGITLICGQAGTGKTTLVRAALDALYRPENRLASLNNPALTRQEFYEFLASSLRLTERAALSKARFLVELEAAVRESREAGALSALVIDEAQALSTELLEEVRLLANLETPTEKLLPVVLAGQPEVSERLDEPRWAQLKQRVALRADISPLDLHDTAAYVAGRIRIAGGQVPRIFTRDAVVAVFQHSGGIPRVISVICDNALVTGFATGVKPVNSQTVIEVCKDLRLEPVGARPADALPPETGRLDDPGVRPVPGAESRGDGRAASAGADGGAPRPRLLNLVQPPVHETARGVLFGDHDKVKKRRFLFF
ncbi:MAG: AAA family ATPase [Acidobacteria bacterium]|nr:AAA family ATPase [Acidobacteriota bacterium]